jgi:hypothetical protein
VQLSGLQVDVVPAQRHQFTFTTQSVSLQVDQRVKRTTGVCTLPNRATLVTLTSDKLGTLVMQQFVLPIGPLSERLPYRGKDLSLPYQRSNEPRPEGALKSVRRLVDIQRQFAQSRDLLDVVPAEQWEELLYMKWFEPIAALLAAYELIRRGSRRYLEEAVGNLREYFGQFPDVEALAKMADMKWQMPSHPPLLLDGFLALNLPADKLPMPNEALDFRGPWTVWQGD